jgi:hypothetical protein
MEVQVIILKYCGFFALMTAYTDISRSSMPSGISVDWISRGHFCHSFPTDHPPMPERLRLSVPLPKAYRLLHHGPTVLAIRDRWRPVSASAGKRKTRPMARFSLLRKLPDYLAATRTISSTLFE